MSWGLKLRGAARRLVGVSLALAAVLFTLTPPATAAPGGQIGVLVPIVADATDGQLIPVEQLEANVAPDGRWGVLLRLAASHHLTAAVDTRILASIDALGNDVPTAVATWRNSLDPLHPLLLPWGNADPWAYSTWATNPFTAAQFGALAGVDPSLLVIWPSGKVVDNSSVVMSQNRGFTRMIVFDDQFTGGLNRTASTVLADAVTPGSTVDIQRAARDIRALVAGGDSIALPADPTQVDPDRASSIISALLTQGTRGGTVPPKMVLSSLTPRNEIAAPDRLVEVMNAYAVDEGRVGRITDDVPTFMMNRLRALTAVTAQLGKSGFNAAASEFESDSTWMSDLVSISLATEYTVLSNTAEIPVTVSNESSAAVTVTVSVRSTSAIVQVAEPRQTITIEPKSNSRIMVPMTAIANGRTTLVAQLFDSNTTTIGSAVAFPIEVQAQWEIVTVIVFFGSVSIIMTIGIIRTIRRRRAAAA